MAASSFVDDITIEALEADPYPIYRRLRAEAPVAYLPAAEVYFVTRFDDCASVGVGDGGFVAAKGHPTLDRVFGEPNVLTSEGETHDQIRAGTDPRLKPASVNEVIDGIVRPVCRGRLEEISRRGGGDLMAEYFEPVSVESLRHVMGLDEYVDSDTLRRWFHGLNGGIANLGLEPERFAAADAISAEIDVTLAPLLARLTSAPDDSLIGHMMWTGVKDGRPRPPSMLLPTLKVILLGGMQEPGHGAGSTLHGLFGRPEQLEMVTADPTTWVPAAVNEGLRWIAPIGAIERQASRDTTVRGVPIPEGAVVECIIASANRDETRFEDPDTYDLLRATKSHQAFGAGHHFCAGHFFARQVERIMFEELLPALPGLRPDPDAQPHLNGWFFRAPLTLPAQWEPVAPPEQIQVRHSAPPGSIELEVAALSSGADAVRVLELRHPDGADLPPWEPGAHIDLWVDQSRAAQYSLCSDPAQRGTYRLGILRETQSRGASAFVHETLREGDRIHVGMPRNNFRLRPAEHYAFIAGGIGVTAMLPMVAQAQARGIGWRLDYSGRSRAAMAFLDELATYGDQVVVHADGQRADLPGILAALPSGTAVYCCGPERMLDEVTQTCERLGIEVHVEHFAGVDALRDDDVAFDAVLASTGDVIEVASDETLLAALQRVGRPILNACQEGNCGSCETGVLDGAIEHRDLILTPAQLLAGTRMMVCVSRAAAERVVLDL